MNHITVLVTLAFYKVTASVAHYKQDSYPVPCTFRTSRPLPAVYKYVSQYIFDKGPCLIAQFEAHIEVGNENYITIDDGLLSIDDSTCPWYNKLAADLTIKFRCGSLKLQISRRDENSPLQITDIHLTFGFPKRTLNYTVERGFGAALPGHAYRCDSEQMIQFTSPDLPVTLVLSNMIVETFRDDTKQDFYQPQDHCTLDKTTV